jgi:hypothetical protein
LAAAADELTATQPVDPSDAMAMDLAASANYVADPSVQVNVIAGRNVVLGSGQKLTFTGDANSLFVLKISGDARFGDGIALNGVTASHLLIYATAANSSAAVSVGGQSGISGTFLSLDRQLTFSGQGNFRGALISGASLAPAISITGNGGGVATEFVGDAFCSTK